MEHKNHKLKEGRAGSDSTRFFIGADAEHDSPPSDCTTLSAPEGKTKIKVNGSRNSPRPSGKSGQKRPSACLPCLPRSCVSFVRRRPLSGGPAFRFFGPFFCLAGPLPSLVRPFGGVRLAGFARLRWRPLPRPVRPAFAFVRPGGRFVLCGGGVCVARGLRRIRYPRRRGHFPRDTAPVRASVGWRLASLARRGKKAARRRCRGLAAPGLLGVFWVRLVAFGVKIARRSAVQGASFGSRRHCP